MNNSISIANPDSAGLNLQQKLALATGSIGILILLVSIAGVNLNSNIFLPLSIAMLFAGAAWYAHASYGKQPEGIKNNGVYHAALTNKGAIAWIIGIVLTGFYVLLYWFPASLGLANESSSNTGIIALFDPLSQFFTGKPADQWFVYGTLYTVAILAMGYKFLLKYRHNRYQIIRTLSVMFFQLFTAYLIPQILEGIHDDKAYFAKDIKNMWPLNHYFFESWHLDNMLNGGSLGMFYLVFGIFLFAVGTPILSYFYGKRWYCSWVCGCGGLAETAGDPFRHNSTKTLRSWKIERWMVHGVLLLITIVTIIVLYGYFTNSDRFLGLSIYEYFTRPYGFVIGAAFSGVAGVGFYPILGNRVWCRFGCPLAAYIGLFQRFKSRFRITTNGDQCISCGNCSTYCEMGIDVKAYAQRGQNIVRSSCVGCGICSAVCPRGVLKLENGPEEGRFNHNPELVGKLHEPKAFGISDQK
ncbi:MAG: 4Fe-4S dicluster domain-containing protein [Chitinophagales bacterium]